jgi:fructose-1,6-bisphosphatase/inositol monophosphatase family enzyme
LIALLDRGEPVLGVLDQPISGERWIGARGRPSLHNDRPIRTRPCADLAKAALFTTAPELFDPTELPLFERVHAAVKLTRYGTDCYAYGLVALGCIDVVIEAGLKLHDYAALIPIIEGAGGVVTGWRGEAMKDSPNGRILASGDRRLHDEILQLIS